jgi:hypothetical protein
MPLGRRDLDGAGQIELLGCRQREIDRPHGRRGVRTRQQRVRPTPIDTDGATKQPALYLLDLIRRPRPCRQALQRMRDLRVEVPAKTLHKVEQFAPKRPTARRASATERGPPTTTTSRPEGRLV